MHEAGVGAIQVQTHVNLHSASDSKLVGFKRNPRRSRVAGCSERSHELQRYVKNLCLEFKGLQIRPDISLFFSRGAGRM